MLDSGVNVMTGDKTMCSLVGDNKAEGDIVSRLYTERRQYLVVAVPHASWLLPLGYLVNGFK